MLLTIENLISQDDACKLRKTLRHSQWQDGSNTAGAVARTVKFNQQLDDNHEITQQIQRFLLQKVSQNSLFVSAALPEKIYPPKFNRYAQGGHYGQHIDSSILYLRNRESLRSDLSATVFLSNPEDYQGGELVINTHYGRQEIKLKAGDMVLYPSTSLHEVMPVTDGVRLCSFFWVQSLVRDAHQREQLFELDQVIQQLTQERGLEDGQVKRLSGIYHNLIRGWANN